jgi:hypothetical protein
VTSELLLSASAFLVLHSVEVKTALLTALHNIVHGQGGASSVGILFLKELERFEKETPFLHKSRA